MRLKFVVLECPIETWSDPRTRALFNDTIALKLAGYGAAYARGVISIDAIDFVGNHVLVCEERPDGALFPITGIKSAPLERCDLYRMPFPAFGLLRSSGAQRYESVVQGIIDRAVARGRGISFNGSWTIWPVLRENRELAKELRDRLTALLVLYHRDYGGMEWIACGSYRFGTHNYLRWVGMNPITEPFAQFTLGGEKIEMLHYEQASPGAIEVARQYEAAWEQRITLGPPDRLSAGKEKKAA